MKLTMPILTLLALACLSGSTFAQVDPPNLRSCSANISGYVEGMYSDTWNQKSAVKINGNFYYLSWGTKEANVQETAKLFRTAMALGKRIKILECDGRDISSAMTLP